MPPSTWRWSRHGFPRRLSAGSSGCTRAKAWSVSSNIAPAPGLVGVQERDAIDLRHHQQQSAAAVLGPQSFPRTAAASHRGCAPRRAWPAASRSCVRPGRAARADMPAPAGVARPGRTVPRCGRAGRPAQPPMPALPRCLLRLVGLPHGPSRPALLDCQPIPAGGREPYLIPSAAGVLSGVGVGSRTLTWLPLLVMSRTSRATAVRGHSWFRKGSEQTVCFCHCRRRAARGGQPQSACAGLASSTFPATVRPLVMLGEQGRCWLRGRRGLA
jgi:hypothetical protein